MATKSKSRLLAKLRKAIQKVKFILSFNSNRWVIFSSVFRSSSSRSQRRVSFKSQPSGLLDITDVDEYHDAVSSSTVSRSTSIATDTSMSPSSDVTRSSSDDASSESNDINKRADEFIANFHRHIQMERQVSLQLRYCRGQDLERARSEWREI